MPQEITFFYFMQNRQNPLGGGFIYRINPYFRIQCSHTYHHIISLENLLAAWKEFVRGKKSRKDVQEFERDLMTNILSLYRDLSTKTYRHAGYHAFKISDPKPRDIHKATVRDRLVHHALHRILYPFFDRTFSSASFSCRVGKGTHKALDLFQKYSRKISHNHTRTAWVLKCDIRKFFASINQQILLEIMYKYIPDAGTRWLIAEIVSSFQSTKNGVSFVGVGLPLGNLTSQLLVNVYMNEFDQYMKHTIKAKYYIRYADDFVIFSENKEWLTDLILHIQKFLSDRLRLELHPKKILIQTVASGVDYLGWVHFPDHRVIRTVTKKRMMKKIHAVLSNRLQNKREQVGEEKEMGEATVQSYLGMLSHGNSQKLIDQIKVEM
jgi:RNA-directed DNA polymerase